LEKIKSEMEIIETLNKIDSILKKEEKEISSNESNTETKQDSNSAKEVLILAAQFLLGVLRAPFDMIASYLKNEIIKSVKNDAKLYMVIMGIMGVMFVFFSVLWLFISIAIGVYFYQNGHSMLVSILYSIGFQLASFTLAGIIAFIASTRIKSLKLLKKL